MSADQGVVVSADHHHRDRAGRALAAGVAGFVAVHLLALGAFEEPSLDVLVGTEALAVAVLGAGDAATTGDVREAMLVVVAVLAALCAVGLALGVAEPWVVVVGLLATGGGVLSVVKHLDRPVREVRRRES